MSKEEKRREKKKQMEKMRLEMVSHTVKTIQTGKERSSKVDFLVNSEHQVTSIHQSDRNKLSAASMHAASYSSSMSISLFGSFVSGIMFCFAFF